MKKKTITLYPNEDFTEWTNPDEPSPSGWTVTSYFINVLKQTATINIKKDEEGE